MATFYPINFFAAKLLGWFTPKEITEINFIGEKVKP